jgi:hypothetical protein
VTPAPAAPQPRATVAAAAIRATNGVLASMAAATPRRAGG